MWRETLNVMLTSKVADLPKVPPCRLGMDLVLDLNKLLIPRSHQNLAS